jgi:hypothetical protein
MLLTSDMSMRPAQVRIPKGNSVASESLQIHGFLIAGHVRDALTNPDKPRGWRIQWHRIGGQNTKKGDTMPPRHVHVFSRITTPL